MSFPKWTLLCLLLYYHKTVVWKYSLYRLILASFHKNLFQVLDRSCSYQGLGGFTWDVGSWFALTHKKSGRPKNSIRVWFSVVAIVHVLVFEILPGRVTSQWSFCDVMKNFQVQRRLLCFVYEKVHKNPHLMSSSMTLLRNRSASYGQNCLISRGVVGRERNSLGWNSLGCGIPWGVVGRERNTFLHW